MLVHCINLNTKIGGGLKNLSVHVNYIYIYIYSLGRLCHENISVHIIYKSIGSYNLYKHTCDMIVKNIVSLNHNVCTNVVK